MKYAFPLDELRPLSCDGKDTWGSYSLTLIDALDSLIIMGNVTEFRRATELLLKQIDLNKDVNISVFETNIRSGLISAHLLSGRSGMRLEENWPCDGPLLRLAKKFGEKLLPAFDTNTFMPYGTVNLALSGVPPKETNITCAACIGTFILEFGALSRLTGDPKFEQAALRALKSLWNYRSNLGLLGNHIDVQTGRWTALESTIGTATDSLFEYLAKGSILFRNPELHAMFIGYKESIDKHLKFGNSYYMVNKDTGSVTMPAFQSLEAFWPSVLILTGETKKGVEHLVYYYKIWKKYGFLPEFYNVISGNIVPLKGGAPLRPEFAESILYAYQATKDPYFLEMGADILFAIEKVAKTECGFASVKDVTEHTLENRMESFFLAETAKYLYLLFDPENFINKVYDASESIKVTLKSGHQCSVGMGGWIFNTEAHPIDPHALDCCYPENDFIPNLKEDIEKEIRQEKEDLLQDISFILNEYLSSPIEMESTVKQDVTDSILIKLWKDSLTQFSDNVSFDERAQQILKSKEKVSSKFYLDYLMKNTTLLSCPIPSLEEKMIDASLMDCD
ncbi:ER degradation-enhancing alpha-mannosidase-like protein 2 [Cichlidogyrus casuarinus]|uniref:alpha-1,2-Mannosidase n=1 Tax=Cichlidogyrus casuarinus TaxID=1844966 RepID=A0ABD2QH03_9PLAT